MADTPQAAAQRREYYLQMMRKARQLNDQILIRLILKKLARLGRTGARSTAGGCMVFPFPAIQAPVQTLDQGPHIPDFLTSNDSKGGEKMDKKVAIFFSLFALLIFCGSLVICFWLFPYEAREDRSGMMTAKDFTSVDHGPRNELKVSSILMITQMIGAISIVLLVGILLKKWFRENKQSTIQGYILKITRVTGKSAYDVFCKAAEDWPVSEGQIEQDFKRYMSDESIPYYVNDFIRKNKKHLDEMRISIFMFKGID